VNNYFAGTIDEVAVYPNALTAAQVSTHYLAKALTGPAPERRRVDRTPGLPGTSGCAMPCEFE
jgi:hypothetical protein